MSERQHRVIATANYDVTIGAGALAQLSTHIEARKPSRLLVVADSNTALHCLPKLEALLGALDCVAIPAGESFKHLESCKAIWARLTEGHHDRDTLVLNLGGGLVGDLGGFAASCYKRGVDFIQIPTSLLAMVDASVGGKTGVNFMGFKNQVGAFQDPIAVIVDPHFLSTLPERELRSGYAEVLKHCLIADAARWQSLSTLPSLPSDWEQVIADSIAVKAEIVAADPREQGIRAALNFGHTVGHAVESFSLAHDTAPLLHGEAVALGMVCEAYISQCQGLLSPEALHEISHALIRIFGRYDLPAASLDAITDFAFQDKKNQQGQIRCTLLDGIGRYKVGQHVQARDLLDSLDFYTHFQ